MQHGNGAALVSIDALDWTNHDASNEFHALVTTGRRWGV